MSLDTGLLKRHEGPLAWGVRDCVQFAADAVEFYSGRRPTLPTYSSEREARAIIAQAEAEARARGSNEGGLEALVTIAMGAPIHPKDAQLGDIVLTTFRDYGEMLGVVDPPGFWLLANGGGFVPVKLSFALRVWACRAS